jgi:uncharacterized membrane protein
MPAMVSALYILLLAAAAVHVGHYYPLLPDRLATHFGVGGRPNGWMSKQDFVVFYLLTLAVTSGVLLGVSVIVRLLPPRWINLPNKDYWLAPERREQTLRSIGREVSYLGIVLGAFLIAVNHLVIRANLEGGAVLDERALFGCMGVLIAVMVLVSVRQWVRFRHAGNSQ